MYEEHIWPYKLDDNRNSEMASALAYESLKSPNQKRALVLH